MVERKHKQQKYTFEHLGELWMKVWKEYSRNINEYYGWTNDGFQNDQIVMSYNISGVDYCKEKFWEYCKNSLMEDLKDFHKMYVYMIAVEKIMDKNSKVEHYKKCWKKISDLLDEDNLELSSEMAYKNGNSDYYLGLAKTKAENIESIFKIIKNKENKYLVFMSYEDYFENAEKYKEIVFECVTLGKYEEINYPKFFAACNKRRNVACRYGTDSMSEEFALVIKRTDMNLYLSNCDKNLMDIIAP